MIYEFNGIKPVIHETAFIHPQAAVTGNVVIGKDVYIGPGCALRGDWGRIIISDGCNVQENCTVHMFPGVTVLLKESAHIGHGAIIHGATIGRNCMVGMNAVIMDEVELGDESIVGALCFIRHPFWSFFSHDAISILVALDDTTVENGCLWYLPGTHRSARFELTEIGSSFGALFDAYPEWLGIEPVAAPCAAGGAVFHNGLVAHAAGANITPRPRRAMTCAYMPLGSTFNGTKNILPDAYVESLEVGDVLDDDRINPVVYQSASPLA